MFFNCFGIHKNVVQIYKYTTVKEVKEYIIHCSLKSGWRGRKSERHYSKLVSAVATSETSFHFVAHTHRDLMIPVTHVELTKDGRAVKTLQQLVYPWERIAVTARLTI